MTVMDLIVELCSYPAEMEIGCDVTRRGASRIKIEMVSQTMEVTTDTGERYVLINPKFYGED